MNGLLQLVPLLFLVLMFFALRQLWLWYYKINKVLGRLDRIDQNVEDIARRIQPK